jgi:hypothetical protein
MNVLPPQLVQRTKHLFVLIVGLVLLHLPAIEAAQTSPIPYKHAYYLFLEGGGTGCEECYVPLLITRSSLNQIAAEDKVESGLLIITYERDSIWQGKGSVTVYPRYLDSTARTIHLTGKKYRYQEIGSEEVLKLLEHPMGTIPISRPRGTGMPPDGPSLADLIKAFKNIN